MTNVSKNQKKKKCLICFDPDAAVFLIMMGQWIYTFMTNFFEDSLSIPISSEVFWIEKLDYFHEGICFPNNGCHGNRKRQFLSHHSNGCYKEKKLLQKLESYRLKPQLQKLC